MRDGDRHREAGYGGQDTLWLLLYLLGLLNGHALCDRGERLGPDQGHPLPFNKVTTSTALLDIIYVGM